MRDSLNLHCSDVFSSWVRRVVYDVKIIDRIIQGDVSFKDTAVSSLNVINILQLSRYHGDVIPG